MLATWQDVPFHGLHGAGVQSLPVGASFGQVTVIGVVPQVHVQVAQMIPVAGTYVQLSVPGVIAVVPGWEAPQG
jgi:hypothetical protein